MTLKTTRQFVIRIECEGEYDSGDKYPFRASDIRGEQNLGERVREFFTWEKFSIKDESVIKALLKYLKYGDKGNAKEEDHLNINSSTIKVKQINFLSNDEYDDNSFKDENWK